MTVRDSRHGRLRPLASRRRRRTSWVRIVAVMVGSAVVGAVARMALGVGILLPLASRVRQVLCLMDLGPLLLFGGLPGAVTGAVLAPPLAWIYLCGAPVRRALSQTAIGTLLGAGVSIALAQSHVFAAAVRGLLLAAVRLYVWTRQGAGDAEGLRRDVPTPPV